MSLSKFFYYYYFYLKLWLCPNLQIWFEDLFHLTTGSSCNQKQEDEASLVIRDNHITMWCQKDCAKGPWWAQHSDLLHQTKAVSEEAPSRGWCMLVHSAGAPVLKPPCSRCPSGSSDEAGTSVLADWLTDTSQVPSFFSCHLTRLSTPPNCTMRVPASSVWQTLLVDTGSIPLSSCTYRNWTTHMSLPHLHCSWGWPADGGHSFRLPGGSFPSREPSLCLLAVGSDAWEWGQPWDGAHMLGTGIAWISGSHNHLDVHLQNFLGDKQ